MQKKQKTPIFILLDFSKPFSVKQTLFLKRKVTNDVGKCRQDCKYFLLLKHPCKSASTERPNLNCDLVVNKDFNRGCKNIISNRCPLSKVRQLRQDPVAVFKVYTHTFTLADGEHTITDMYTLLILQKGLQDTCLRSETEWNGSQCLSITLSPCCYFSDSWTNEVALNSVS